MKKGDFVRIVGLAGRTDLNNTKGFLTKWRSDLGRWEITCIPTEEGIRVKPVNLRTLQCFALPDVLADTLKSIVRGSVRGSVDSDVDGFIEKSFPIAHRGQITSIAFEAFEGVCEEAMKNSDKIPVLPMMLDCIGKEGDSELIVYSLVKRIEEVTQELSMLGNLHKIRTETFLEKKKGCVSKVIETIQRQLV